MVKGIVQGLLHRLLIIGRGWIAGRWGRLKGCQLVRRGDGENGRQDGNIQRLKDRAAGIDERTGMLDDGASGRMVDWQVYGQGKVTLYRRGTPSVFPAGASFTERFDPKLP